MIGKVTFYVILHILTNYIYIYRYYIIIIIAYYQELSFPIRTAELTNTPIFCKGLQTRLHFCCLILSFSSFSNSWFDINPTTETIRPAYIHQMKSRLPATRSGRTKLTVGLHVINGSIMWPLFGHLYKVDKRPSILHLWPALPLK
jgi:hypothetical protein